MNETTFLPPNSLIQQDEILFTSGSDFFKSLLTDIDKAQQTIYFETYIFKNDKIGKQIVKKLIQAAQRGVRVYVLVDGCGSPFWGTDFAVQLEKNEIKNKVYHPFPWQLWNWSRSVVRLPFIIKWVYLLFKMTRRNHRKVCIIDERMAYAGSINVTMDHIDRCDGGKNWRDIAIKIQNTNLQDLIEAFHCSWNHRTITERLKDTFKKIRRDPRIRLNNTWHRRRILYRNLIKRIRLSKTRIWIINAYFVPDSMLLKGLNDAAQRGVDVRVLLPQVSDHFIPHTWASATFYSSLLTHGVQIFEYLPSVLHAKTMIIDDWFLVGSSNLDHLSLLHNLEVDITIQNQMNKHKVNDLFLNDLKQSQEINKDNWKRHRPWYQRFFGRIFLYAKYWM
tara:strand:- start:2229 stop:3401 length:1173 start_codon:yes stop_codon:yes gene_type:complete